MQWSGNYKNIDNNKKISIDVWTVVSDGQAMVFESHSIHSHVGYRIQYERYTNGTRRYSLKYTLYGTLYS